MNERKKERERESGICLRAISNENLYDLLDFIYTRIYKVVNVSEYIKISFSQNFVSSNIKN